MYGSQCLSLKGENGLRTTTMLNLDPSQTAFCQSKEADIRLLAPAGCGKTASLLHRCRELTRQAKRKPRFLIVTFTKGAAVEIQERLANDPYFEILKGQANITTLNAYGWSRIRTQSRVSNPRLLTTATDLHFAMRNQLHPVWVGNQHIETVVTRPGSGGRTLMTVMDNLKSMGFDHTTDTSRSLYQKRMDALEAQGLTWRIDEQFDLLTNLGILDSPKKGDSEGPSTSHRAFYDRFFTFWRKATERLLDESTFTFEDQKYWTYLDIKSPGPDGKTKPAWRGMARYHHIMVDEFQDINPLDVALIRALAERSKASLTIVGDDDQAIFEWRGATPEYILNPDAYLGKEFTDYQLAVNYRSPGNIVNLSQRLIANNKNRVAKRVSAVDSKSAAKIDVVMTDSINERLSLVTDVVGNTTYPGKVAVMGRLRRQLIPYQVYYASDGAPFKTAVDLDVFNSDPFDNLVKLIEIWERSQDNLRPNQVLDDTTKICDLIKLYPMSKKNREDLRRYLRKAGPKSVTEAAYLLKYYDGPKLSGKTHLQLQDTATGFLNAGSVANALRSIGSGFSGLKFDAAKDDIFFTAPPMSQLADIAENERFNATDLITRIETVKDLIQEYRDLDPDYDGTGDVLKKPMHLMTATRAKGKEFDTVILLDTVNGIWPHQRATDRRELEAERRLFYVAFTRAKERVIMLTSTETGLISPFIDELGLSI